MKRPEVLVVAGRLAWPIREGYTLRVWHLACELAEGWDVTLLCVAAGQPHESEVPAGIRVVTVPRADDAFATTPAERAAVREKAHHILAERQPQALLVSGGGAHVVPGSGYESRFVLDMIDCGTLDTWRNVRAARGLRDRASRLRDFVSVALRERTAARAAFASILVGADDARMLRRISGSKSVHVIPNGVHIREAGTRKTPAPTVVFSGVMGYPPNVEAVAWFARKVWPAVHAAEPTARFLVAGRNPVPEIQALHGQGGVEVLGEVADMHDVLAAAWLAVAPMRTGVGIKNKVLEAWAAGTPAVLTSIASNGLSDDAAVTDLVRDSPRAMAELIVGLLRNEAERSRLSQRVHALAAAQSWPAAAARVSELLHSAAARQANGTPRH